MMGGVYAITLGCKLNFAETATYLRQLAAHSIEPVRKVQEAQVVLINSCSVTHTAQKKCRQVIHWAQRRNPHALCVVVGCFASLAEEGVLQNEGAHLVLGNTEKPYVAARIMQKLAERTQSAPKQAQLSTIAMHIAPEVYFPAHSERERTRAFLKVQDGCNYRCSYCVIPQARGKSRWGRVESIVEQAQHLEQLGIKEIVITGVNTGDFGRGTPHDFAYLLEQLATLTQVPRYRISSIEPNLLTERVLTVMARYACFMPHVHIPLQSGSARILGLMRRRYSPAHYVASIERARAYLGHLFVGVDVIVGFPTEEENDFAATYTLLERVRPSALHVFPFSSHEGTVAHTMEGHIAPRVKTKRVGELLALSQQLEEAYRACYVGQKRPVLVERAWGGGYVEGFSDNYLRMRWHQPGVKRGDFVYTPITSL